MGTRQFFLSFWDEQPVPGEHTSDFGYAVAPAPQPPLRAYPGLGFSGLPSFPSVSHLLAFPFWMALGLTSAFLLPGIWTLLFSPHTGLRFWDTGGRSPSTGRSLTPLCDGRHRQRDVPWSLHPHTPRLCQLQHLQSSHGAEAPM